MYSSDDEGKSWSRFDRDRVLMAWVDSTGEPTGKNGVSDFNEPYATELKDGRVLMFGRSELGRVLYSLSDDGGTSWTAARPTVLASSFSPSFLKRIPKTGDLLCVWNQVSREEIRRSYRRGRLSTAISKDDGATWTNFKTMELSEGLEDIVHIAPELPLEWVKARSDAGVLPDGWSYFHYPSVDIVNDQVFIRYLRGGIARGNADQNLDSQGVTLRGYPLDWFYK